MLRLTLNVYFLFCVCFIEIYGSSSIKRYVQTNTDLQLTVTEEVKLGEDFFYWKCSKRKILEFNKVRSRTFPVYKGRAKFFSQNLSLILQNVMLNDSGIYTAVVSRYEDELLASFDVTVEAPVSPVQLSVDHVTNSAESCNFTMSCSSISRSFTCDNLTCEELGPPTPGHAPSLHIYLSNDNQSVICNHSNHVSWRNDTMNIKQLCPLFAHDGLSSGGTVGIVVGTVGVICCCLAVAAFVFINQKRRKDKMVITENSVYSTVTLSPSNKPSPDERLTESPSTIYSEVQPHPGPAPAPVPAPRTSTQAAESVYATVNKPSPLNAL